MLEYVLKLNIFCSNKMFFIKFNFNIKKSTLIFLVFYFNKKKKLLKFKS